MAKITRKTQKQFASDAGAVLNQMGSFRNGSVVHTTDPDVIQALTAYLQGLDACASSDKHIPVMEEINALYFLITRQLAYQFQEGIPEWDTATTYYINSVVKDDTTGDLYISLADNNTGNALTDATKWGIYFQPGGSVPIGTIIPFYDYNAALSFDTSKWAYCNGQTKTIAGIGSQTLPDLSGRYLVGFGTDGGADLASATWATAAVGNAGNVTDLTHTHAAGSYAGPNHTHGVGSFAGPSHTHTGPSHTHTGPSHNHTISFTSGAGSTHSHGAGTLYFKTGSIVNSGGRDFFQMFASLGAGIPIMKSNDGYAGSAGYNSWQFNSPGSSLGAQDFYTKSGGGTTATEDEHTHAISGSTASAGTGNTGASGTGATGASGTAAITGTSAAGGTGAVTGTSGSGLTSTQSIQPRSIRVRYIMRIA